MDYYYQVMPIGQINDSLTYKYSHSIEVGSIVEIPLRKRKSAGVIVSQTNIKDLKFDLKKVLSISNYYQKIKFMKLKKISLINTIYQKKIGRNY